MLCLAPIFVLSIAVDARSSHTPAQFPDATEAYDDPHQWKCGIDVHRRRPVVTP
jgi:hypothetical protein